MTGQKGFFLRNSTMDILIECFLFCLIITHHACDSYPFFGGKRYLRTVPIRRSYISIPVAPLRNEYQFSDYEDAYIPNGQNDYEYGPYENYPIVQYLGFQPSRNYFHEKNLRKDLEGVDYFDDQFQREDVSEGLNHQERSDGYPYGQETWYEEEPPKFDRFSEANKAFLENLIMSQMYRDSKTQSPYGRDVISNDYEDQHWLYGVPTTKVEDKEKVKQYFENKEDEDVLELESLARKKGKNKKPRAKDNPRKQKEMRIVDKPAKPKSKMTDDEYFDMQKQLVINSRKRENFPGPAATASNPYDLRLKNTQYNGLDDLKSNFWSVRSPFDMDVDSTERRFSLVNDEKRAKSFSERKLNVDSTTAPTTSKSTAAGSIPATRSPAAAGQKEVVLPRPSNPVRRRFNEINSRSSPQPSDIYDTIKKLLNMEKELQKEETSQPRKRFVLNEDQLTAELSGLKRKSL